MHAEEIAVLYKYASKENAMEMTRKGVFCVSLLSDFRDIEKHADGVADGDEGTKVTYCDDPVVDFRQPETVPKFVKARIRTPSSPANLVFKNIWFTESLTSRDYYIFCVTEDFSLEAMRRMGHDTCVRIDDPLPFFKAITECLQKRGHIRKGPHVGRCVYTNRVQHYSRADDAHPALIKAPSFAYQKEVRAIWTPSSVEIKSLIFECRPARMFCSLAT